MKKIIYLVFTLFILHFTAVSIFADDGFNVTFNSGTDGTFENGNTQNIVHYSNESGYKISYSSNLNEYGERISDYKTRTGNTEIRGTGRDSSVSQPHTISFPGSESLLVDIFYAGNQESPLVSIYQEINGNRSLYTSFKGSTGDDYYTFREHDIGFVSHAKLEIPGDTISFSYSNTYRSGGNRYGYYAFVRPKKVTSDIYLEPVGKNGKTFVKWDQDLETITEDTVLNAIYYKAYDVTLNSTGNGKFSDGSTKKNIKIYKENPKKVTVAHSANVNDNGDRIDYYRAVTNATKTVTISGASKLSVIVIEDACYYGDDSFTATNSSGTTVFNIGRASVTDPDIRFHKYTVEGNTINFKWTRKYTSKDSYGWFAKIYALDGNGNIITDTSKNIARVVNESDYEEPVPNDSNKRFLKWNPLLENISSNTTANAVYEDSIISQGNSGCKWTLYENGELTIGTNGGTCTLSQTEELYDVGWSFYSDKVKKVTILGTVKTAAKQKHLFQGMSNLTEINISKLNTSASTDLTSMFEGCSKLESLDLSSNNMKNAEYIPAMFSGCTNLKSVKFPTMTAAAYASKLFEKTKNLKSISWGSGWQKLNSTDSMFSESGITSINLTSLNLSNVETANYMFYGCDKLISVNLNNFGSNGKIKNINSLFENCSAIESIDLSMFKGDSAERMNKLFSGCTSLRKFIVNDNNLHLRPLEAEYAFKGCDSLDLSLFKKIDFSQATKLSGLFSNINQDSIDLNGINTSSATSLNHFFDQSGFKELDVNMFDLSNCKEARYFASNMPNLEQINLKNFSTKYMTNVENFFYNDPKLKEVDLSYFDFTFLSSSSNSDYIFGNQDTGLKAVYLSDKMKSSANDFMLPANGRWKHVYSPDDLSINDTLVSYTVQEISQLSGDEQEGLWILEGTSIDDTSFVSKKRIYSDISKWDKLTSDTWVYTLYVEDDSIPYYLSEGLMADFVSDIPNNPGYKVITDGVGEITNTSLTKTGSLTISKALNGPANDKLFKFIVTLSGEKIQNGSKYFGNYLFNNGEGEIFVKAGETAVIDGIPTGTHYSVEEVDYAPYHVTYENNEGTINESGSLVRAVNTYVDSKSGSSKADILLSKVTEGFYADNEYTIYCNLTGLSELGEYTIKSSKKADSSFNSDESGNAFVELSITPGETITMKDIPDGATYIFTEKEGPYYSSYSIKDENNLGLIRVFSGTNNEKYKALSTSQEFVDDGEKIHVTFTNRFQDFENLKISKTVTGEDESETRFEFTVVFNELPVNASFESDIGRIIADDEGRAEKTFLLADGESVEFTNVPVGTRYYFKESPSVYKASFNIEELKGAGGSITKASAANITNKKELQTAIEVIEKGEYNHVIFTNSPPQTKSFTLKKELLEGDANKDFEFTIYLKDVNNPIGGNFDYTGSKSGSLFFNEAGYASISLKKDQYIVINGLPQGATVAVKENDYVGDGYAVAEVNAVVNGTTTSVNVENNEGRYSVVLDNDTYMTVKNGPANMPNDAVLTIKKNVSGNLGNRYKDFEFDISATGIENFAFTKNGAALTPTITSGKTTITLKHNDVLTITAPVGTQITIEEHDYTADGYSTYIGNSLTASRSTTVTLEEDSEVIFNNSSSSIVSTNVAALQNLVMIITLCSSFIILLILVLLFSRKYKEKRG